MIRAVLLALAVLLLIPAGAAARPLLDDADAAELTQSLAEAAQEQGVCYGYAVAVSDDSGGESGTEIGSNLGPGRAFDPAACPRWIRLEGTVRYTCDACDSEDSADARIVTGGLAAPIGIGDLERLGFAAGRLTDDDGDAELENMVGALPLLLASRGAAPAIPVELSPAGPAPNGDRPTGSPPPDWLKERAGLLLLCALVAVGGLVWLALTFRRPAARRS